MSENYLIHYGVKGMQWGKHLPGVLAVRPTSLTSDDINRNLERAKLAKAKVDAMHKLTASGESVQSAMAKTKNMTAADAAQADQTKTTETKKSSGKKGSSKKKSAAKTETTKSDGLPTDQDIVKNALGNNFDAVLKKVQDHVNKTGRKELTADEMKAMLGDSYDSVKKSVETQLVDRNKKKEEAKAKGETTDTKAKASTETKTSATKTTTKKTSTKKKKLSELEQTQERIKNAKSEKQMLQQEQAKLDPKSKESKEISNRLAKIATEIDVAKTKEASLKKKEVKHTDYDEKYLAHHGIKGQRWGVRRFQNSDGSLTSAGRNRYNENPNKQAYKEYKAKKAATKQAAKEANKEAYSEYKAKTSFDKEKALKIGAAALGTAAAVGLTVYAAKHPEQMKKAAFAVRNAVGKGAGKASEAAKSAAKATGKAAVTGIKNTGKMLGETAKKTVGTARDEAVKLAVEAAGVAAAAKVAKYYSEKGKSPDTTQQKINEITEKAVTKALKEAGNNVPSGSRFNQSSNGNNGGKSDSDISRLVGHAPKSKDRVSNNDPRWGKLLSDIKDPNAKQTIKNARQMGYDWDELEELKRKL